MDVTAALTLNGELVLDKPIKVAKTKIKSEDDVQVKVSAQEQKGNYSISDSLFRHMLKCWPLTWRLLLLAMTDAKCLFLKNLPFNVTKEDIKNIFKKAVDVRFPGGSTSPTKGSVLKPLCQTCNHWLGIRIKVVLLWFLYSKLKWIYMFFHSIAFLEFKNKTIAQKVQKNKQGVKIQDRVLIVDFVGEGRSKVTKVDDNDNEGKSSP